MIPRLKDYENIVGKKVIDDIRNSAERLKDKHVVHVNATSMGGGVAEILNTLVFLMNDVGIKTGWRVLHGSQSFFNITKGFHNSLQGADWKLSKNAKRIYIEYCKRNAIMNHIKDHDIVVIHDPQPLGMVSEYEKKTMWLWRCHIDISDPNKNTFGFLLPYIKRYDGVISSSKKFRIPNLKNPQITIAPSIDPLSEKNEHMAKKEARSYLKKYGVDDKKPIISQISRFDPWKDPIGVIKMYKEIKKQEDCQLVLLGNMASDDPQGPMMYNKVLEEAKGVADVKIITENDDKLVNALQRESCLVFQNSKKEGFALTVSEALWKGTPVIGRPVGGIPLQITDGKVGGFLVRSRSQGIRRALELLRKPKFREDLAKKGKEHVRKNFLITRHLKDYIDLFNRFYPPPDFKGIN